MIVQACWVGSKALEENPAWKLMRSSVRERDMSLAPEAVAWLAKLPWPVQPRELCQRYPRIVNRLALVWPDSHLTNHYFDALLNDKRGGRRGFDSQIAEELIALRSHHAELHGIGSTFEVTREKLMQELRSFVEKARRIAGPITPDAPPALSAAA